jgi:N-acylneuraminate cytidylyltransferase
MRWVAFLPLQGNFGPASRNSARSMAGRPLFSWSLKQAITSGCFDTIYVTADPPVIRKWVVEEFSRSNTTIEILDCTGATRTGVEDWGSFLHAFQQKVSFDVVCSIQPTSPLTHAEDFRAARHKFLSENLDSLLTATLSKRFLWTRMGKPIGHDPLKSRASWDASDPEGYLLENSAFYLTHEKLLRDNGHYLGGRMGIHEMAPETAIEITDEAGWNTVERLLRKQERGSIQARASRIKFLVLDVDGTLTDAGMYYGPAGEALKKFNTRDAHGLQRVREQGIGVCVITTETSPSVEARMRKLRIDEYYPGVSDKLPLLLELSKRWGIPLENIGYVGDDLSDLECLSRVGVSFCPADAVPQVAHQAHYVCEHLGGHGAVREVCDLILRSGEATRHGSAEVEAYS